MVRDCLALISSILHQQTQHNPSQGADVEVLVGLIQIEDVLWMLWWGINNVGGKIHLIFNWKIKRKIWKSKYLTLNCQLKGIVYIRFSNTEFHRRKCWKISLYFLFPRRWGDVKNLNQCLNQTREEQEENSEILENLTDSPLQPAYVSNEEAHVIDMKALSLDACVLIEGSTWWRWSGARVPNSIHQNSLPFEVYPRTF